MRIETYTPQLYPALAAAAQKLKVASLLNREFVDWYYLGQPWSELRVALDESGNCVAFLGFEKLRFELNNREIQIGMATNFYTLDPGVGGFLWLQWMKACGAGLVFGGNEHTHRITKAHKFVYYPGINTYTMNARFSIYQGEPAWRRALKTVLRPLTQRHLNSYRTSAFERKSASVVIEEIESTRASRIASSSFTFRFAPSQEYMRWRYDSSLRLVRYRWFNIVARGTRVGYCVLNDAPQQVIVSYSEGMEPEPLAYGVLKAIFHITENDKDKRTALLACSHPDMQRVFTSFGFILDAERPFAIRSPRSQLQLGHTSDWLINFGLGDSDLRPSTFHTS